jgi:hypothetical protein
MLSNQNLFSSVIDFTECKKSLNCSDYSYEFYDYCEMINGCLIIDGKCGDDPHCELEIPENETCKKEYCMYDKNESSQTYKKCLLDSCSKLNKTSCAQEGRCVYKNYKCKYSIIKPLEGEIVGAVVGGVIAGTAVVGGISQGVNSIGIYLFT